MTSRTFQSYSSSCSDSATPWVFSSGRSDLARFWSRAYRSSHAIGPGGLAGEGGRVSTTRSSGCALVYKFLPDLPDAPASPFARYTTAEVRHLALSCTYVLVHTEDEPVPRVPIALIRHRWPPTLAADSRGQPEGARSGGRSGQAEGTLKPAGWSSAGRAVKRRDGGETPAPNPKASSFKPARRLARSKQRLTAFGGRYRARDDSPLIVHFNRARGSP